MTNFQVYKKTLSFSFINFLFELIGFAFVVGGATLGYILANDKTDKAFIGLAIGLVLGIVVAVLIKIFINNRIKAGQIAMMTKGVVEDKLPDHPYSEGMKSIKGRFGKITAFFFITGAIKGIFNQLGHALNRLGTALGGDVGNSVTSAINSGIQILIGYLCDCCLGWILYRKNENAFKAGCEGAVIFFKHGKTLIRNVGRIFGMGLLSFLVIGGLFGVGFYFLFLQFPNMFTSLVAEINEIATRYGGTVPEFFQNPTYLMYIVVAICAIALWSMVHSVVGRPFILVGVLRNYMAAGIKDIPTEKDFEMLDAKSPKFRKLHSKF